MRRAERLELFDELEEWYMIQRHYCVAVGVNDRIPPSGPVCWGCDVCDVCVGAILDVIVDDGFAL